MIIMSSFELRHKQVSKMGIYDWLGEDPMTSETAVVLELRVVYLSFHLLGTQGTLVPLTSLSAITPYCP